jgi:GAF domain-containing protein
MTEDGPMATHASPPYPADEPARQRALEESGVLRLTRNAELQQIVERAAKRFRTPIAAISVIDRDRQWIAARRGIDIDETTRDVSFCAHTILRPAEMMVVPDTTLDRRFAAHPYVIDDPHIRFYAGAPLVSRSGYALGALCIVDHVPRDLDADLFDLSLLAREAEAVINRR